MTSPRMPTATRCPSFAGTSYGTIDRTSQDAQGYGGSVQAVDKTRLFGMGNQFLIGASYDHGDVDYGANSELGFFGPKFVVNSFATPFFLAEPDDVRPRKIATATITLASMSPTRPI